MASFKLADLRISFGFSPLSGAARSEDRQCGWEFYTELVTRAAARGVSYKESAEDFAGEPLWDELVDLEGLAAELRSLICRYPVGRLEAAATDHLGLFMAQLLELVVRPFLQKWKTRFEVWCASEGEGRLPAFSEERQQGFADREAMCRDWGSVRLCLREAATEVAAAYGFPNLLTSMPQGLREAWRGEPQ